MKSRTSALKKINVLYGLLEEMHSGVFRQTVALVNEAEQAIAGQAAQTHAAAIVARAALLDGDRQQWVLSSVQRGLSGERRRQLETVRAERVLNTDRARDEYQASRVKSKQIKSVVEQSQQTEEVLAGRRTQAAADDRFLSRLRWKQLHAESL